MDVPEIVEAFDADFKADPYSMATAIFKEVIEHVLDDGINGAMSSYELNTIEEVAKVLMMRDPALNIEPRAG
jgi:hypothetical protein